MTITQEMLIHSVAQKEGKDAATIRRIVKSIESTIFDCLSSTTSDEPTIIKVLNGFCLEGTYTPETTFSKGMFQNTACPARIRVKPAVSRYYNRRLNENFSEQKPTAEVTS